MLADFFDGIKSDELTAGGAVISSAAFSNEIPSEEDLARVDKALSRLPRKAPIAMRLAIDLIERSASVPIEEGLRLELSHLREIFSTRDAYEGLSSLGKRQPVFQGR